VYFLAPKAGWWPLVALFIVIVELRRLVGGTGRRALASSGELWKSMPGLIVGLGATLIIATVPRHVTQVAAVVLYAAWLLWRERIPAAVPVSLLQLLIFQGVLFEAIFLMAAIWQIPAWLTLILVWAGSYLSVYGVLRLRNDKSAGVMAATWAVIAVEVSWVLLQWLIIYTMRGGYVLVPQPALILTALAYIFGSILVSSRQGNLSRARLGEYLAIGLILVVIVVVGTSWRGNV
jgi:hypothetical protein